MKRDALLSHLASEGSEAQRARRSDLVEAITTWADHWNDDPKPFISRKAADEIIDKV